MSETENFIIDFVRYNEGTEVPDIYALWSSIGAVSCALGRRVFLDMGHHKIFGNMYIVLVGQSGSRKSTAILQAENFIREITPLPNLISQKITPEALIKAIRQAPTDVGVISFEEQCTGFAIVDELNTFLNRNVYDAGMGSLLTSLYDCKSVFEYQTLSRGKETAKNACLGILGGATIEFLQQAVPETAVGSGLTSRFVFVYVSERSEPVPITSLSEEKKKLAEALARSIRKISTLNGTAILSREAVEIYSKEYVRFYKGSPLNDDKNLAGYASRRGGHVLKLALVLSVAESPELLIKAQHVKASIDILSRAELSMPIVLSLITSSAQGTLIMKIYTLIKRSGVEGITRSTLLSTFMHQMSAREFSEVTVTLLESRKVKAMSNGVDVRYYAV